MRSGNSAIGTIVTGKSPYVGRFAPSPTGPLHFGSLLAAIASYLQARQRRGRWFVRVEDIDPPREQAGATDLILAALERYGFEWHGPVVYQSQSRAAHEEALRRLASAGFTYPCGCSRKDLADAARGPLGIIYPGTCRAGCSLRDTATRVRTTDDPIEFRDALQGTYRQHLESESGDFVVWRRDGLVAYHLAVVVDDYDQGVSDIVRGVDLLDSTPRQIWLQRMLGFPTPAYTHIPVATHPDGQKLSKLTGAAGLPFEGVRPVLATALQALRQDPPGDLAASSLADIWAWALEHWRIERLAGLAGINVEDIALANGENGLW